MINAIGLYDSGIGGLTVLAPLIKHFPEEVFIYYADSGRAPYGNRDEETLFQFNKEINEFLFSYPLKLLIVACNTSDALFLKRIKKVSPVPVIGLIHSAARDAVKNPDKTRIVVLGTQRLIESGVYSKTILSMNPRVQISGIACPKLVPLIESGEFLSRPERVLEEDSLFKALDFQPDILIYGCSHYPVLYPIWKPFIPSPLQLINPGMSIIPLVKSALEKSERSIGPQDKKEFPQVTFWISGDVDSFQTRAYELLPPFEGKFYSHTFEKKQIPVVTL